MGEIINFKIRLLIFLSFILLCNLCYCKKLEVGLKRQEKNKTFVIAQDAVSGQARTFGEVVASHHNLEYTGIVSVGTPPQTFEVVLDTGSDLFWLPETGCQSTGVDVQACSTGQGLYNPRSSSSAVNTNKAFGIRYGTGSASGNYYNDVMSFGDAKTSNSVSVGNITLGAAQRMTFSDQGILGLSFPQGNDPTPVFQLAVQRNVFDDPVFTVFLRKCDHNCDDGGLITFGAFDNNNCQNITGDVAISGTTPYWLFNLDGIEINGNRFVGSTQAIVDTGTSIIVGPTQYASQLARQLGASTMDGQNYFIDCNAQFTIDFIINGKTYAIDADQLILRQGAFTCTLGISGDSTLSFWILGDPFLRQYCVVHNVNTKTLQFAPSKYATHTQGGNNPGGNSNTGNQGNNGGNGNTGGNSNSGGNGHGRSHNHGHGHGHGWPFSFGNNGNDPFGNGDLFGNDFGNDPFGSFGPYDNQNNPFGGISNNPFSPYNNNRWPFGGNNFNSFGQGGFMSPYLFGNQFSPLRPHRYNPYDSLGQNYANNYGFSAFRNPFY